MKKYNPDLVNEINEQFDRESKYLDEIIAQFDSIPFETSDDFSPTQHAIHDEMSKYGSTLIPSLTACGVFSCIGLTAHLYKKWNRRQRQNQNNAADIITNEQVEEIPYSAADFYSQN